MRPSFLEPLPFEQQRADLNEIAQSLSFLRYQEAAADYRADHLPLETAVFGERVGGAGHGQRARIDLFPGPSGAVDRRARSFLRWTRRS
jgi:hypothetical protein